MKALLDTNVVLWWFSDNPVLPPSIHSLIDDAESTIFVSAASAWEICTKVRIGKVAIGQALCESFSDYLERYHFEPLAITVEHGRLAGRMAGAHRDPFDRMLAAQALVEGLPLVTNDPAFAPFGVEVLW